MLQSRKSAAGVSMKSLVAVVSVAAMLLVAFACGDAGQLATPVPADTISATRTEAPTTGQPTGATGDEEFFNVEFWRSLVAVGLGAVLGFGIALAVGYRLAEARRSRFAKFGRNVIVTESIYNLKTLNRIEERTRRTLDSKFTTHSYHEFQPRGRILERYLTPDVLSAISSQELVGLVVVGPELEHLAARYSEWTNTIARDDEPMAREKTRILLELIRHVGTNVLALLIAICSRAGRDLLDENAQRMAKALSPIKVERPTNFTKALRSSHLQDAPNLNQVVDEKTYLVVWEHDWSECPTGLDVIELQKFRDRKVIRYSE